MSRRVVLVSTEQGWFTTISGREMPAITVEQLRQSVERIRGMTGDPPERAPMSPTAYRMWCCAFKSRSTSRARGLDEKATARALERALRVSNTKAGYR